MTPGRAVRRSAPRAAGNCVICASESRAAVSACLAASGLTLACRGSAPPVAEWCSPRLRRARGPRLAASPAAAEVSLECWVDGVGSAGGVRRRCGLLRRRGGRLLRGWRCPGTPVTVPGDDGLGDAVDAAAEGSADAAVVALQSCDAQPLPGTPWAAAAGAVPLIAAANAVRLARAAASLDFVSSSNAALLALALAFGAVVPDVPVGFGSAVTLAAASPVAGVADSSSPKILSASRQLSVLHFAADVGIRRSISRRARRHLLK